MKITVTNKDIKNGRQHHCFECPIALAVRRACQTEVVSVGGFTIKVRGGDWIKIPRLAVNFIGDFDLGKPVQPFSFNLKIKP